MLFTSPRPGRSLTVAILCPALVCAWTACSSSDASSGSPGAEAGSAGASPGAAGNTGVSGKGGSPSQSTSAAEAFTDGVSFNAGVEVRELDGSLPEGQTTGPQVQPLPPSSSTPVTVAPGGALELLVPWSGGSISSVNISFGGSRYFQVSVPQAASKSSGIVAVPGSLAQDVCTDLASTCHQIQCYEQVVLPDGSTVSKALAQQMILNCSGGKDCSGGSGAGGTGGSSGAGGAGSAGGSAGSGGAMGTPVTVNPTTPTTAIPTVTKCSGDTYGSSGDLLAINTPVFVGSDRVNSLTLRYDMGVYFGEPTRKAVVSWEGQGALGSVQWLGEVQDDQGQQYVNAAGDRVYASYLVGSIKGPGQGFGVDSTGSPSWSDTFVTYTDAAGVQTQTVTTDEAKKIYKACFKLANIRLLRLNGKIALTP